MWTARHDLLDAGRTVKVAIDSGSTSITYAEAIERWQTDADFRALFVRTLCDVPFKSYRWETPPITKSTSGRPFEFVLIDSPNLAAIPDESAFADQFRKALNGDAVEFPNLGHDAILVVPTPKTSVSAYNHLANFVRQAPDSQKHALWQLVGSAMIRRLSEKPVWLSTAGAGVSWLHVRLDEKPKYYAHGPYRDSPRQTE
jgi:hypothetical protein